MIPLPIANVLHHKLRSALSALGVAIGVCMLVTLSGLTHGTLAEVGDRWQGVDADLIVYPSVQTDNIAAISGAGLSQRDVSAVTALTSDDGSPAVERATPVYINRLYAGGQHHNIVGVDPEGLPGLMGGRSILDGRCFDPEGKFARWLHKKLTTPLPDGEVLDISKKELADEGGLEMVIDTRLAKVAGLKVGDKLLAFDHDFTIVGIVPDGALARAFIPRATAEYLCSGLLGRYTLLFVKVRPGVAAGAVANQVRRMPGRKAMALNDYTGMLEEQFRLMYVVVAAVDVIVLAVVFLFILVTLFTMVIQRTREIAILRSMGASGGYIVRGVCIESLILTVTGFLLGVAMSFGAAELIRAIKPLLTVTITPGWIALAAIAALAGGALAALYPASCAVRVDVVEALNLE